MKISVLIVNYNGKDLLAGCLRSIRKYIVAEHEIIVVDNASTDGSADYVKEHFPEVKLIVSEKNLGFAGGNNLGALEGQGEYLLLLNNDTVLLNEINPVIELMDHEPAIGVAGVMMLDSNKEYSLSAGNFPSPLRLIRITSMLRQDGYFKNGKFIRAQNEGGYGVDWVAGCFLLTRLSLWRCLSGLDEGFFMYGEDVDYCRRSLDKGFTTCYYPDVSFLHYGGFTLSRFPMVIAGFKRYHEKHSNWLTLTLASAVLHAGLYTRVALYSLLYALTRAPEHAEKAKASRSALRCI